MIAESLSILSNHPLQSAHYKSPRYSSYACLLSHCTETKGLPPRLLVSRYILLVHALDDRLLSSHTFLNFFGPGNINSGQTLSSRKTRDERQGPRNVDSLNLGCLPAFLPVSLPACLSVIVAYISIMRSSLRLRSKRLWVGVILLPLAVSTVVAQSHKVDVEEDSIPAFSQSLEQLLHTSVPLKATFSNLPSKPSTTPILSPTWQPSHGAPATRSFPTTTTTTDIIGSDPATGLLPPSYNHGTYEPLTQKEETSGRGAREGRWEWGCRGMMMLWIYAVRVVSMVMGEAKW
ncbi:hypothetical protein EV426DRAFT_13214 [Tirmania nivea]|nr:hypothetical protein EV426DRAFT_13214 [Tirmania nivea]